MNETTTLINPIISAEQRFIEARNATYQNMAETANAGVDYGARVCELRNELGSDKALQARLIELGTNLPIEQTHALMKAAARCGGNPKQLFTDRSTAQWAQLQMGLLPPRGATGGVKAAKPATARDALACLAKAIERLQAIMAEAPSTLWTEDEITLARQAGSKIQEMLGA